MYVYEPPLTETEKESLTTAILEDLVYRTAYLSPKMVSDYIEQFKAIWAPESTSFENDNRKKKAI